MNIVVEVAHLNRALSFIKGCVPSKSTIPILQHVRLSADGSTLTVRATNLEQQAEASCPVQIDDEVAFTLPGALLSGIVAGLPQGAQMGFASKGGDRVEIRCGGSKFSLRSLSAEDFPTISREGDVVTQFALPAGALLAVLGAVAYASEKDILVQPELYGVHLFADGAELVVVSCDLKRLAQRRIRLPQGAEKMVPALIPLEGVQRIMGALKGVEGDVTLGFARSFVEIATDGGRLSARLMDKELPNYLRNIVPPKVSDFRIYPAPFRDAVERANQVYVHCNLKSKYEEARLSAADGTLTVSMGDLAQDVAREEVEADVVTAKTLCVDARYLMDFLRQWPEDGEIDVYQEKPGARIYFSSAKYPDDVAMIAPMASRQTEEKDKAA